MRVSIIGEPGSGKSTLARLLSGIVNVMVISSGDLARSSGFAGSKEEMNGKLDPDESKIRRLVIDAIGDSDQYILDGFPRTIEQIEEVVLPLNAVIYLDISQSPFVGINRILLRGRPDDTEDIAVARIATYYKHTFPLVKYFDNKGILIRVDATGTIANTLQQTVVKMSNKGIVEASIYIKKMIKEFERGESNKSRKISKNRRPDKRNTQ